jgi:hypothetical protein
MAPIMAKFSSLVETDQTAAVNAVMEAFSTPEGSNILFLYILGFSVPWFFLPAIFLALTRVALGLWDGFDPSLNDLSYAFKNYLTALATTFYVSLYLFLGFILLTITLTPFSFFYSLTEGPVMGGLSMLLGVGLTGALFIFLFWPFFRRAVVLQVLPFFTIIDGTHKTNRISQIFRELDEYRPIVNQAGAITLFFVVVPATISAFILLGFNANQISGQIVGFLLQLVMDLLTLWPFTALAGCYRIILYPQPPEIIEEDEDEEDDEEDEEDAAEDDNDR